MYKMIVKKTDSNKEFNSGERKNMIYKQYSHRKEINCKILQINNIIFYRNKKEKYN